MDHANDIPQLLPADQMPLIHTADDLLRHWRTLLGPLGFSERMLWYCFIEPDGYFVPMMMQVEELPIELDTELVRSLMSICGQFLESIDQPDNSIAFLLSRPWPANLTESDRAWVRELLAAGRRAGLNLRPIHVATDYSVHAPAPDDLI